MIQKPLLVFQGPISTRSGYGDHAKDLLMSLIKMDKFDIKVISTRWGATPMNQLYIEREDDLEIVKRILRQPLSRQPDVFVQVTVPNEFQPVGKYNIGITAGVETTAIPLEWIHGCNRMDLIITPSQHAKNVLEETIFHEKQKGTDRVINTFKVSKPIEVLFEGTNTDIFKATREKDSEVEEQLKQVKEKFNYLFVGHWLSGDLGQDRKDVGMLIKTFLTVFKNRTDAPGLILKTSGASFSVLDRERILKKIRELKASISGDLPNIYLLHGDLSPEQMNALYNHTKVKAMVCFTKGEGYGRPLQEFSFTGKPIICSNWSGQLDFLRGYAELVGGQLTEVHPSAQNEFLIKGSKWFTVDYNSAAGIMDKMFTEYKSFHDNTKPLGKKQAKKFALSKMDEEFVKLFDKYVKVEPSKEISLELPTMGLPTLTKL